MGTRGMKGPHAGQPADDFLKIDAEEFLMGDDLRGTTLEQALKDGFTPEMIGQLLLALNHTQQQLAHNIILIERVVQTAIPLIEGLVRREISSPAVGSSARKQVETLLARFQEASSYLTGVKP